MEDYSEYKVEVSFRENRCTFEAGWNTSVDLFEQDEVFTVPDGYKAWYTVLDANGKETAIEGNLMAGEYRLHDGYVEKKTDKGWIKPKRFQEPYINFKDK